ncbi:MAG TPA: MerR family transcriptional regulator [Polyangiaceae bacterium]|nr:MerR family transcriptional regulator [Polyangiaceae bacterium]
MTDARYRIGTLARLTGVTTHAIRIWERRYAALSPSRTPGGARLYTDADVQRLRQIKKLLEHGHTISGVAKLDTATLARLAAADGVALGRAGKDGDPERARAVIDELLSAITEMDLERAGRTLVQATNAFSPHDLVIDVLAPTLDEIGKRWASGELCTASEHAASAMLRTQLGALLSAQPVNGKSPVICTTPAGEQHELGALLAAVVIAMHGRRAIYLGANLPAEQIAEAARRSRAGGVALSIVGLPWEPARRELDALCEALPPGVEVLVGGRRGLELSGLPSRIQVLGTLPELETWLANAPH